MRKYVDLPCTVKRITQRAILVTVTVTDTIDGLLTTKDIWFPKSQVHGWKGAREGDIILLEVPRWLLVRKEKELGNYVIITEQDYII